MYKVFLNDKPILFSSDPILEQLDEAMLYMQYHDFEEINFVLNLLEENHGLRGLIFQSDDLEELWADFRAHFREVDAAGGLVRNEEGALLMIHRFGRWDLPKGKMEYGENAAECALREVKEECGIEQLELGSPLTDTYHVYSMGGMRHLKRTAWYEMSSSDRQLSPQREEGIVEATWKSPDQIDWKSMPTYANIKMLVDGIKQC